MTASADINTSSSIAVGPQIPFFSGFGGAAVVSGASVCGGAVVITGGAVVTGGVVVTAGGAVVVTGGAVVAGGAVVGGNPLPGTYGLSEEPSPEGGVEAIVPAIPYTEQWLVLATA